MENANLRTLLTWAVCCVPPVSCVAVNVAKAKPPQNDLNRDSSGSRVSLKVSHMSTLYRHAMPIDSDATRHEQQAHVAFFA